MQPLEPFAAAPPEDPACNSTPLMTSPLPSATAPLSLQLPLVAQGSVMPSEDEADECGGCNDASMQLDSLADLQKSELYDLANELLADIIPGWHDDDDEDMEDDDYEDEDAVEEVWHEPRPCEERLSAGAGVGAGAGRPGSDAHVVDASYHACIQEVGSYLVHCEGLAADDEVLVALRQHLHMSRIKAVQRETLRVVRTPGGP